MKNVCLQSIKLPSQKLMPFDFSFWEKGLIEPQIDVRLIFCCEGEKYIWGGELER